MDTTTLVVVITIVLFALGIAVLLMTRRRDFTSIDPGIYPPTPATPTDLPTEVAQLLAARQKIAAIKRVREVTDWGLKEAKDYVEALERGNTVSTPVSTASGSAALGTADLPPAVKTLLEKGRKIEAVKLVREATGWGLKEVKDYVDALESGASPPAPLPQPLREPPIASGITPELAAEVRQLLARRQKIEAVKRVRMATGWGLKEAKAYVDAIERDPLNTPQIAPSLGVAPIAELTPEIIIEVRQLLTRGQKIEAVKRVRMATGWGLRESKAYVDALR